MYADAFNACYYDNPGVCTAFVVGGVTDKFTFRASVDGDGNTVELYPLLFTEDYERKPAYDAILNSLKLDQDILPDYLAFSSKAQGLLNKPYCVDCDGECRYSWPLGDPLRGNSGDATWRCKPTYKYSENLKPNWGFCEDWCTACSWSWSVSWADKASDERAAFRCDMSE